MHLRDEYDPLDHRRIADRNGLGRWIYDQLLVLRASLRLQKNMGENQLLTRVHSPCLQIPSHSHLLLPPRQLRPPRVRSLVNRGHPFDGLVASVPPSP